MGLLGITKVFSRYVVAVAGVIMVCAGLCPKVSALCSVIPTPVFGGAVILTFGIVMVSGMQIIMRDRPGGRTTTILAVSLAVGLGFSAQPEALASFPLWVSMFLSGVPGTALTAVALNLILPGRKKGGGPQVEDAEPTALDRME